MTTMTQRRQRPGNLLVKGLFFTSFFLIVLNGCGGSSSAPNPCYAGSTSAGCVKQSSLLLDIGSKAQMRIHDSQVIKVVLYSQSKEPINKVPLSLASIPAENATVATSAATPVGTPGTTLFSAFGPGYEPFATATLTASPGNFSITLLPVSSLEQPLAQNSILWKWLVVAKQSSTQILDVDVEVVWKPISAKLPKQGPLRIGEQQISIQVTDVTSFPTVVPTPTSVPTVLPTLTSVPTVLPTPTPTPASKSPFSDPTVIAAIIGGIVAILVAVIGLVGIYIQRKNKEEPKPKN